MGGNPQKSSFPRVIEGVQIQSIKRDVDCKPSKGQYRTARCTVSIIGLNESSNG